MRYLQGVPRNNQVHTMALRDFTGGLNNRSTQLEDNQASDLLNMKFVDDTLMEKRNGIEYYGASFSTDAITYMGVYSPYQSNDVHISASDTKVFADGVQIATVLGKINGCTFNGNYHFVDGTNMYVYGTFPQVDDAHNDVIGTPVATRTVMRIVTPPAGFTPLPNPNIVGVWKYNYTTATAWYEPCAYEISDVYKGSNVYPEKPQFIEVSKDRMYISGSKNDDDNVFITDIANPFYTPVYLPIQMPPNGDRVTGLKVFHDSIVVGRYNDIHIIYGNTTRTDISSELFRLKRVNAHSGFASQDAMAQVTNYLFYLGNDRNVYSMLTPKTDTDMLVTTMINRQIDITKAPINLADADIRVAKSVYYKDEWYVSIGDKILIYSYRHQAWTMFEFQAEQVTSFVVFGGVLYMGLESGRLAKFNASYSDLGYPIRAYWKSKNFDAGQPIYEKFYRDFFIIANSYIDSPSTITLAFEVDYINQLAKFDVTNKIAIWGSSLWGDNFFSRNINASRPFLLGQRGRSIRISLESGYNVAGSVATHADLLNVLGTTEGLLYFVTAENAYYAYESFTWVLKTADQLYQPMKVFEINGQYEFRGVR
jgi:hypothetical protein